MVKSIYTESNSSAGARTIAGIATTRGLPLSRYVATRLMKEQDLVAVNFRVIYIRKRRKSMLQYRTRLNVSLQ